MEKGNIIIEIKEIRNQRLVQKGEAHMIDKIIENNRVSIVGEIVSEFRYSHEVFGEGFYMVDVSVDRLSELTDTIPLMVSERLVDVTQDYTGRLVEVSGQFRSYNRHEGTRNKLVLSIFVREWEEVEENLDAGRTNQIFLDGFICKPPITEKHRLEEKSQIYLLQLTDRMVNQITYLALPGAEMQDMHQLLKWVDTFRYGEECKAESTLRRLMKMKAKSTQHMKCLSAN